MPWGCKESDATEQLGAHMVPTVREGLPAPHLPLGSAWGCQVASGQMLPQTWVSPVRDNKVSAQGSPACCPLTPWQEATRVGGFVGKATGSRGGGDC